LSAAKPAGLAGAIAERRGRPVVLTGGEQGAWVATSRFGVEHVAAPQVPVQDTTGAGDALVGTVAAGLDIGMPLIEAVRRGVVAGSLSCTRIGAQPSLPTAAELEAAMGA
jgi:ribokinase